QSKRQEYDPQYFKLLEEMLLDITHIVGYREIAEQINFQIYNTLPIEIEKYLLSHSKDIINEDWRDMNKEQEIVRVAFCINRGIVDVEIYL
ncbi:11534_t:CDS:2, partial [Rhizophagus irregularis]